MLHIQATYLQPLDQQGLLDPVDRVVQQALQEVRDQVGRAVRQGLQVQAGQQARLAPQVRLVLRVHRVPQALADLPGLLDHRDLQVQQGLLVVLVLPARVGQLVQQDRRDPLDQVAHQALQVQ